MEMRKYVGIEVDLVAPLPFNPIPSMGPSAKAGLRKASARKGSRDDGGAWRPRPCWAQESSRSARSSRSELSTALGA